MNRSRLAWPLAIVILFVARSGAMAGTTQARGDTPAFNSTQTDHAPTTVVVRGTIDAYDASAKVLSVSTPRGKAKFTMTPKVRIRQGWRRIDAAALGALPGYRVAVRYAESDDVKTVESIRVFRKDGTSD